MHIHIIYSIKFHYLLQIFENLDKKDKIYYYQISLSTDTYG
jgi:hypothetical protein